ncbi:hypothetical protein GGR50DRAFT_698843 [Xylaria sp. CBS 124048]|nr:hypothetical protein GGR50DRAFT_698843 [Xylaria sp. CBS 124048]
MADQCIVCLDNLDVQSSPPPQSPPSENPTACDALVSPSSSRAGGGNDGGEDNNKAAITPRPRPDGNSAIAVIEVCGHTLHDSCLREWTGKANSCPICRQAFHLVHVYDKVGGVLLSSYKVEDKKQVAEFDPQAWLDENPEEEDSRPCAICSNADHEEVLLLCDRCDAPYHTYCVGLDAVPRGHWFCLECSEAAAEQLASVLDDSDVATAGLAGFSDGQSGYLPRTQASMRRDRQRARSDEWQGAWGIISGRVFTALDLDLDNHEDDEAMRAYRRSQQRSERERREYQRWQQRLNIASRLGARDVFADNIPIVLPQPTTRQPPPQQPPAEESPEERQAWGALEKAMEAETPNQRKRKSRSATASPTEPPPVPERKLKRPRTRRVPIQSDASSSHQASAQNAQSTRVVPSIASEARSPVQNSQEGPSFLSSLLKEVEMSTVADDENIRGIFATTKSGTDPQSPATSPSPSGYSSPRALSMTPPPRGINDRPGSPLSLSSRIEPVYPPANYIAARDGGEHSDSESRPRQQQQPHQHQPHHHNNNHHHHHHQKQQQQQQQQQPPPPQPQPQPQQFHGPTISLEIRQPRPQRHGSNNNLVHSRDASPTHSANLPFEMKESISGIVKDALKPHWKSGLLTADQYASINRDLSHKLYKEVSELELDDRARVRFEKIATREVARAVADVKA